MTKREIGGALVLGLLALSGCGGSSVNPIGAGPNAGSGGVGGDLGSQNSGGRSALSDPAAQAGSGAQAGVVTGGGGAASGGAANVAPVLDPMFAAQIAATWKGYIENYTSSDGSSAVVLVFAADGTGQATFGASPAPPAVTDPSVGYPPEYQEAAADSGGNSGMARTALGGGGKPYPGFPFQISNVSAQDSRLQLDISPDDLWSVWCQKQTPIADQNNVGVYSCVPNWGVSASTSGCTQVDPSTMKAVAVDCSKLYLCELPGLVCRCAAQGCAVATRGLVHFDLNINASKADGSVAGLDGNLHNVHLSKD